MQEDTWINKIIFLFLPARVEWLRQWKFHKYVGKQEGGKKEGWTNPTDILCSSYNLYNLMYTASHTVFLFSCALIHTHLFCGSTPPRRTQSTLVHFPGPLPDLFNLISGLQSKLPYNLLLLVCILITSIMQVSIRWIMN